MATNNANHAPTTMTDDDSNAVSVGTTTAYNRTITAPKEICEYVVKFMFRPKTASSNTNVAKNHYTILRSIVAIYPEAHIFDNFGSTMTEFPTLNSYDSYLHHFQLQYVKGHEEKRHPAIYLAFHRFRSSVPIGEI